MALKFNCKEKYMGLNVNELDLSSEQMAAFKGFAKEDQAEILGLKSASEAVSMIEALMSMAVSTSKLANVELHEAKSELENITIFSAGGPGFRAGTTFRAALLGTHHIYSTEYKENWEEYVEDDNTWYYNSIFKFDADGKQFGIWNYGTLSDLRKIPTLASRTAKSNPIVEVTYVGKVEGRDVLKSKYNIELTRGNEAHVFIIKTDAVINRYEPGTLNSLNAPFPVSSKKSGLNKFEATRQNYERILAAQGQVSGLLAQ